MLIKIFVPLSFSFFSLQLLSQEKGSSIIRSVTDKKSGGSIEFATVQLLKMDSTVVTSSITDKKGKFILSNVKPASYILRASFIGYERSAKTVTVQTDQSKLNVGTIEIHSVSTSMNEVT